MTAYRVTTPSGVIADGIWAREADIPAVWRDRFEYRFFTEDTNVVVVEVTVEEYDKIRAQDNL